MRWLLLTGFTLFASLARAEVDVACGFAEKTDLPILNLPLFDPGPQGVEVSYDTSLGDTVNVLVTTIPSNVAGDRFDLRLLAIPSTAGGFFQAEGLGLIPTNNHSSGAQLQIPLPRRDGGIYFVKVQCRL